VKESPGSRNPASAARFRLKRAQPPVGHPNLRKRPPAPSKGRGPVQVRIRRAFVASGAQLLSSSAIYDWTHARRRRGRHKSMPIGIYSITLRTLRIMADPIRRVPPYGAWLWRLKPH
jgi:hypothetical protein